MVGIIQSPWAWMEQTREGKREDHNLLAEHLGWTFGLEHGFTERTSAFIYLCASEDIERPPQSSSRDRVSRETWSFSSVGITGTQYHVIFHVGARITYH